MFNLSDDLMWDAVRPDQLNQGDIVMLDTDPATLYDVTRVFMPPMLNTEVVVEYKSLFGRPEGSVDFPSWFNYRYKTYVSPYSTTVFRLNMYEIQVYKKITNLDYDIVNFSGQVFLMTKEESDMIRHLNAWLRKADEDARLGEGK